MSEQSDNSSLFTGSRSERLSTRILKKRGLDHYFTLAPALIPDWELVQSRSEMAHIKFRSFMRDSLIGRQPNPMLLKESISLLERQLSSIGIVNNSARPGFSHHADRVTFFVCKRWFDEAASEMARRYNAAYTSNQSEPKAIRFRIKEAFRGLLKALNINERMRDASSNSVRNSASTSLELG